MYKIYNIQKVNKYAKCTGYNDGCSCLGHKVNITL